MTPKMCCCFIFQSLHVILNYRANRDDLNSKTWVTYESGHLTVNRNTEPPPPPKKKKRQCNKKSHTSCRGLADLTWNIITFPSSPFMQIASLKLGSSLLMALPIKLEAHWNTNIPWCLSPQVPSSHNTAITRMCFSFMELGIAPCGELPTTDALQSFPQTIGA